jgi:signal transduction histidine kinase
LRALDAGCAKLSADERRYRRIFHAAPVALAEVDVSPVRSWLAELRAAGVGDLSAHLPAHAARALQVVRAVQVLDANQAMAALLEADRQEDLLATGAFAQLLGPVSDAAWTALLAALLERRPVLQATIQACTLGGRQVPVLLCAHLPVMEGDPDNLVVSMMEVPGPQTDERTRDSRRLETVGRLAGGVAHDFNNLLAVIATFAAILRDELSGPTQDDARRDLEVILDATRRGASLINQLLALGRRQIPELQPVNINRVVQDLDRILRRLVSRDIELVRVLDPELGLVETDPGQIEQVLMNLVVNARDAMPAGGRLTVETANLRIARAGAGPAGDWVRLSVVDTGTGMDQATRLRIFEPFFTTKAPGKGTGMGLATVQGIVARSGGHLEVTSAPGQGTRFDIYLPRVNGDPR